jgi:hypothetical protein
MRTNSFSTTLFRRPMYPYRPPPVRGRHVTLRNPLHRSVPGVDCRSSRGPGHREDVSGRSADTPSGRLDGRERGIAAKFAAFDGGETSGGRRPHRGRFLASIDIRAVLRGARPRSRMATAWCSVGGNPAVTKAAGSDGYRYPDTDVRGRRRSREGRVGLTRSRRSGTPSVLCGLLDPRDSSEASAHRSAGRPAPRGAPAEPLPRLDLALTEGSRTSSTMAARAGLESVAALDMPRCGRRATVNVRPGIRP